MNEEELLWRLRSGKPKTIKQVLQRIYTQDNEKLLSSLVEKGAVALNNGKYTITPQGAKLIDERYKKKERKRKEKNKETNVKAEILAYDDVYQRINKLSSEVSLIKNFVEDISKEIQDMKKMLTYQAKNFREEVGLNKTNEKIAMTDKAIIYDRNNNDLKKILYEVSMELDRNKRLGGTIPIPMLREEFMKRVAISREEFDNFLLKLENEYSIDLQTAHDMNAVNKNAGIYREGRGLLYYLIWR